MPGKVSPPPSGDGIQKRAHKLTKQINKMHTQPPAQMLNDPRVTNEYPAVLVPKDKFDNTFATRQRNAQQNPFTGAGPGVPGGTVVQQRITKDDVDYQKRKQQVVNRLRYQKWLYNNINMKGPHEGNLNLIFCYLLIFIFYFSLVTYMYCVQWRWQEEREYWTITTKQENR